MGSDLGVGVGCRFILDAPLALGTLDLEVTIVVVEGEIELAGQARLDAADPNPQDVAGPVRDVDPLTFFALENQHRVFLFRMTKSRGF